MPQQHPSARLLLAASLLALATTSLPAQGWMPGQSISWQRAQAPSTPGAGAIMGGPGNDPSPGSPMYVCRGQDGGSLVPGKWVRGSCNVAFNNSEDVLRTYEVAYGTARWGAYRGDTRGLIQTGREPDGTPLFSCRVHYTTNFPPADFGYQPGKLVADGTCHIPLGGQELAQNPPFDVLYGAGGGYPPNPYPPYPYPYPPQPAPQLPGCQLVDPGVTLNSDGLWVGPNCAPSDGLGHARGANNTTQTVSQAPPDPYQPGPSSVSWQSAQSPFTPGAGAIVGAAGKGSRPDQPLYVCRAYNNGALLPGKWLAGQCSVSYGGQEQKLNSYEVATGSAQWRSFNGDVSALVPGGYDTDGTPLYICRAEFRFLGDKGSQPGRLENGKCLFPYGGVEQTGGPPFDALYNVFPEGGQPGQGSPASPPPGSSPPPGAPGAAAGDPQTHGIEVIFTGGTTSTPGTIAVTNGSTGKVVTQPLPPNTTPQGCVSVLQQAAFQAGLQIQAEPGGMGLRISGADNAVNVNGAPVSIKAF